MATANYIQYERTRQTFRPWPDVSARWLDWDHDCGLAKAKWPESAPLSREDWLENRRQAFTYCAVVEG